MERLPRWYGNGVLCIGDAAHTMSPVGGVGVNLAIQDAVAAARILARPLREGTVRAHDLARVQKRRTLPTALLQQSQQGEHRLIRSGLDGTPRPGTLPLPMRLLRRVRPLRTATAFLGGIGIRPERAPALARAQSVPGRTGSAPGPHRVQRERHQLVGRRTEVDPRVGEPVGDHPVDRTADRERRDTEPPPAGPPGLITGPARDQSHQLNRTSPRHPGFQ
ncbi:FAD-dependent monooxygenase [Streptomyces roseoverticillatus]|uniref:FAD-dependent monooxygenase n=1 Tax=Streptomyces roseoverticillatus TaxID=66429 RepID=A0ABV3IQP3_9ACTN